MDNCPGIGEILGREIDDLKMIGEITEHAAAAIECVKEAYKRALKEGLKRVKFKEAVEKGSFTRCGIWSEKYAIKEVSNDEVLSPSSWVNRVCGGSKETFRGLYFIYRQL